MYVGRRYPLTQTLHWSRTDWLIPLGWSTLVDAAQRALRAHQATADEIRHGLRPKPPEDRTFTDLTTGNVTSWAWDFGDTNSSTTQNPMHTYAAPGTYTVSLTASGPGGSTVETKVDYITVQGFRPGVKDQDHHGFGLDLGDVGGIVFGELDVVGQLDNEVADFPGHRAAEGE